MSQPSELSAAAASIRSKVSPTWSNTKSRRLSERPPIRSSAETLFGRSVYFLPRHGLGHRILPHELNHRANIYALRSLNVRWIICVTAVGSLQEKYAPRDILLPSQFFDRTSQRACHTFFGEGIAAHVSFADPISPTLRELLAKAAREAVPPFITAALT